MASELELIQLLAWRALLYLVFCLINTSAFLVVSINATAFIGASLSIVSGSEGPSSRTGAERDEKSDTIKGQNREINSHDRSDNSKSSHHVSSLPRPP